jgi:glucose-6-phosphate isomerase
MAISIEYSSQIDSKSLKSNEKHWESFLETIASDDIGFFNLPKRAELAASCDAIYEKFKHKKIFVQVGIGGSSLGPEMLITSLGDHKRKFEFINNIDSDKLKDQLYSLNPQECFFYFVSKSGSTAEMTAGLIIITNWLKENGINKEQWPEHMVFATDPKKSQLLDLAASTGVTCLEVPSNVGGRFSVLTPVGYLPALFAGIDIESLAQGAQKIQERLLNKNLQENELNILSNVIMDQLDKGKNQTILMPYSSKLRDLSFWFVQLWAESLGKITAAGENVGLTPLPSYGATDQHSQVQLFMEGPRDKVTLFVRIEKFSNDFSLSNDLPGDSAKKLSHFSLNELMEAELQGTLKAMESNDRPYILFSLPELNAESLGELIMTLECLTVLIGQKLEINPFNQPGVEAGKLYAFEWLDKLRK